MLRKTRLEELPENIAMSLKETHLIIRAYLAGVSFITQDTARDPNYADNHLLSYLAQDILQSSISLSTLAMEGLQSVAKRELRFLVEASLKICFVQQKSYRSTIEEKIAQFEKELSSQRISIKRNIDLSMLTEGQCDAFVEEVGRVYGLTSSYVHLTPSQIRERIAAVDAGRTAGKESSADIDGMNDIISRGLAVSLVLLFHSVPEYVAGDWLVEEDGATVDWYFTGSRFIAGMDSYFDYKHERKAVAADISAAREANIRF